MLWFVLIAACKGPSPGPEGAGLLGDHVLNPFPVGVLHTTDGHVDLQPAWFDLPAELTPLRSERFRWREGFSVGQTSVVVLDSVDPTALPTWRAPTPGAGGIRLLDRTDGVWLPVMAELDAHPLATPNTLLIRPLRALTPGHDVAVVVTTAVTEPVAHYQAVFSESPPIQLVEHVEHFTALRDQLEDLGVAPADVALAWDFPVGDGTVPLRSLWSQVTTPTTVDLDVIYDLDGSGTAPPFTFRAATGTFRATNFLVDDLALDLQFDGTVVPTGEVDVDVYVHVPTSLADAAAGTAPVMVFGHGIFSTPERYLATSDDASNVAQLADELGAIVVALRWRGLTTPDLVNALEAGADFTRIHEITDRLAQAQGNTAALVRLLDEGDLLDHPSLTNRAGERLASDRIVYYGISLGAIEGAVFLANDPPVDEAVLHVGGGVWSTMLERSSNWPVFEGLIEQTIVDPVTRQRLYATSQLWWDPVDPISYGGELSTLAFLLQESIGDEQVPNLSTRQLARSVGFALVEPTVEPVFGLSSIAAPTSSGPRIVQIDPEEGLPDDVNRPATNTSAHEIPRHLPGVLRQTLHHLQTGETLQACGAAACSASNPGTESP